MIYSKQMKIDYETILIEDLEKGDFVFGRPIRPLDFIPGYWTHVAVFAGYDENNEPYVVQQVLDNDKRKMTLKKFISRRDHIMVGKVLASKEQKEGALLWMKNNSEYPFDFWYPVKKENGKKYYCTELIWEAYKKQGVDLDPEDFNWRFAFAVAPQEIFESDFVKIYNLDYSSS